jgi:hypothetical protein
MTQEPRMSDRLVALAGRIERVLGWDCWSPIALALLLVSLDASIFQSICVLLVFTQYSVKIDQIHARASQ